MPVSETRIKQSVTAKIHSRFEKYEETIEFLLLDDICEVLPLHYIDPNKIEITNHLQLADPNFNLPTKIDALIGAEYYYDLFIRVK